MASKATAVLMRLREIDKKYKSRYENKSNESDSDNNNNNNNDNGDTTANKKNTAENKPLELFRPQLNIKIPDAYEEYLDTNSSTDDDNEYSVAVKIVDANDCDKKSNTSMNSSESSEKNNESISESINKIDDLNEEKDNGENIELVMNEKTNVESGLSISEIIDDASELISEVFENDFNKNLTLEKIEENDESMNGKLKSSTSINSIKSSNEKYSDDSFESNSSGRNKTNIDLTLVLSSALLLSNKSETTKYIERIVDVNARQMSKEDKNINNSVILSTNDTEVIKVSDDHTELSSRSEINNDTYELEEIQSQQSNKQLSKSSNNSLLIDKNSITIHATSNSNSNSISRSKNNINDDNNKATDHECSNKSSIVEQNSATSSGLSEKPAQNLIPKVKKKKSSHDIIDEKIDCKKYTMAKEQRNRRRKKNVEHSKGEFNTSKKVMEQKMRRDHVRFRREHECIHSTMIHYLEEMKEERRRLQLLWPRRLICPEKIDIGKIIKPLDFPNVSSFIRPSDNSINQHPDPNMDILRNRLLDIRQWMKDQYLIYREHCSVAASINKKYCEDFTAERNARVSGHL